MRFWVRELAGWVLVVLGIFGFYVCYVLLLSRHIIEAWPLVVVAIVLFRGGIHLLKVAVAARICLLAAVGAKEERAPVRRAPVKPPAGRGAALSAPAETP